MAITDRKQKLSTENLKSIEGIKAKSGFKKIEPDEQNDWVNQGDRAYYDFISIGNKKDKSSSLIFSVYSAGVKTNRDAWAYNHSKNKLYANMSRMVDVYNNEMTKLKADSSHDLTMNNAIIKWDRELLSDARRFKEGSFKENNLYVSSYRPFCKRHLYYSRQFNNTIYQTYRLFPESDTDNLVICTTGVGSKAFSCFISSSIADLQLMFNGQLFPLKTFEKASDAGELFQQAAVEDEYEERDGISDEGFAHFQSAYLDESFSKEDLFYYIYGLLHSEDYRERFQNNLSQELPRIPAVKKFEDFMAFSKAGRI